MAQARAVIDVVGAHDDTTELLHEVAVLVGGLGAGERAEATAVPSQGPVAEEGLRTIPPRENCGNADVKQLTKGSKLFVPVAVDGAALTITALDEIGFAVALVPHTLEVTTLGSLEPGREVNLEVDVLAKYVERLRHADTI